MLLCGVGKLLRPCNALLLQALSAGCVECISDLMYKNLMQEYRL